MIIYRGELFDGWRGNALVAGLSSESLVRIGLEGTPSELERYDMGERIRAVAEGPEGAVYLLEDGEDGRLLKLTPLPPAPQVSG
jgi:glucose/arabinose dehydrogenase